MRLTFAETMCMARNQWQDWMASPYYVKFIQAQSPYPSGRLYENILEHVAAAKDQRILMAGSGNGTKAAELGASGYDITGTDYSDTLTALALPLATDTVNFYQHDLRLPFWSNYFGFAFSTARSFGIYDTRREHENLLRTITGSLLPGGYLLLEYINTKYLEQHPFSNEEQDIDGTHYSIIHMQDDTHFYSTITVTDPLLPSPEVYVHKKQKFTSNDFTVLLDEQGLQVVELFGDDDLGPYEPETAPKLIILARKTTAEKDDAEKRLYSDGRTGDALT
ncbi:MAG: methyltransferase domain-containing protein [Chitinophagaceae bacterium]|nr:MAG: methyltransferase domain-containing protein [Chitinophagaceae bacterium]